MEKLKNIFNSKPYNWMLWLLGALVVLSIVFVVGVQVGLRKARYSYQWGANYERNFMGPRPGMMGGRAFDGRQGRGGFGPMMGFEDGRDFRNAHGLAGSIVSVSDNTVVVKDQSNKENTITVTDKTLIKDGRNDIKITDLKADEKIVVMGRPDNNGTVTADLIRVFDNGVQNSQNN